MRERRHDFRSSTNSDETGGVPPISATITLFRGNTGWRFVIGFWISVFNVAVHANPARSLGNNKLELVSYHD